MIKYEELESEYIRLVIELDAYDRASKLINEDKYDINRSHLLGKKIDNIVVKMLNIDLDRYIKLLDHKNIAVREMTSEYLYPLYPKKCLRIMKEYRKSMVKDVDRIKIDSKIRGLSKKDKFFIDLYKKLYNVDDLSILNRENI